MLYPRREFLSGLIAAGTVPALAPALSAAMEMIDQGGAAARPDQDAMEFWNNFLDKQTTPASRVPVGRPRGGVVGREPFFFHDGKSGLLPAVDISESDLVDAGDVNVSLNLAAFKPANADRATFERLQTAQLRIDVMQSISIVDVLDTLAWTAIALLRPDAQNKLPPIQNLSFDPGESWKKMQNIVLPKGQGKWAVNLFMQRSSGIFGQVLQVMSKEVGRFAPALGLPGITVTALQSFNQFYGAIQSQPEYLFRSNPVPIFATAAAARMGPRSSGIPLRSGTYVLVPIDQASALPDAKLSTLELKRGLLVPKNTDSRDVFDAAQAELPNVTYATMDVIVKSAQLPCGK
jgi:hypothetical protein